MGTVIKVENLSKQYRLGLVNSSTVKDDLLKFWYKLSGKENQFLNLGEANDRSIKGSSDYVWSLKDINFEVQQGEVLGIIGKNGAGKSTLLKILSKITAPTTGSVKSKGRIASLLEVGTGFHPELTGRENIYLNGAILGMKKKEITQKMDEIIDFAGVERYVDTPVKRYSSGMYVRLAFAVAAHLESEILIIDEVLAVGDAEFQKKCLGKMGEISKGEGRTVLFVSHNMIAVKELCTRTIVLKNGTIDQIGNTSEIIKTYLSKPKVLGGENDLLNDYKSRRGNGEVRFTSIKINNQASVLDPLEDTELELSLKINQPIEELYFCLQVKSTEGIESISDSGFVDLSKYLVSNKNEFTFKFLIPKNTFRVGIFPLYFWLGKLGTLAADSYPYDIIDSVFVLNYDSQKSKAELGYDYLQPGGFFNFPYQIKV